MKRKISIFILFVVSLTVYAAKFINVILDNTVANDVNQYEIIVSSIHDSKSSISCDNAFDNPVSSIIFVHCSNIYSGCARTISHRLRSMYRYNPITFSKNGKILDLTFSHYLQNNHSVFFSVKLYGAHYFIRLRKLLI